MGRPPQGWKLRKRPGQRYYSVRFTIDGKQHEPSTGTDDPTAAQQEADRLYAEARAGQLKRKRKRTVQVGRSIGEVAQEWLNATRSTRDPQTNDTYAVYVSAHWAKFFVSLQSIEAQALDYSRARLSKVKGVTVRKELSALRSFTAWCGEVGYLPEAPTIPGIPKRTVGTAHPQGKRSPTELSPTEVRRLLKALPEKSPDGWWVRARFEVMYETTLRPETLSLISVPENYTPGSKWLVIRDSEDKARHARRVPLSTKAQRILKRVAPESGPIFGRHRCRWHLEKAASEALSEAKAKTFHAYDLRAAGITHRLEAGAPITGVQWLAGHQSVATTARYVRAGERAAELAVNGKRKRYP